MSNAEAETEKNAGNEALKAGDFAKAAEHYSKAIALAPTQHVYFSNRSNAYVQLKRYEDALHDANKTIELDPTFARGYGRKGVALFFLGRYKDAAAAYSEGLKVDPKNDGYISELERCQAFIQAEPFLRPDWAGVLSTSMATGALMQDSKFVDKIQAIRANPTLLSSLLNTDQGIQQAFIVLSGLEQKMREDQKKEEARRLDDQLKRREAEKKKKEEDAAQKKKAQFDALPENKQHAFTAKEAGNEAYKNNDFKKALELYSKASEHDPTDAIFLNNMAAAHIGLKDYNSAIQACDKALDVARDHGLDFESVAKIHFRKGKALAKVKRWRESVEAYDAGLVNFRDPTSVKFRNQAEEKMKEQEALDYQDPVKAEEAKNAGNEFFKQENWGDAIRSYSDAIKRNPKNAVYYSNRAISYIKVREYQMALDDADKCLELDPSFIKGWVRKGMAHHFRKEYYKAIEAYEKGFKIDPEYAELKEWAERTSQAMAKMRMGGEGNKEDVEEARKRALADPEIQKLLKDGEVQNFIAQVNNQNQKGAQEMLQKSASLFEKYQKLQKAGLM